MSYPNYFTPNYQAMGQQNYPQYQQPPYQSPFAQQPVQAQPQNGNSINWVTGIEGAKSYLVGAGQSVLLMDSENQVFYIKATDSSGMPLPLRIFSYSEQSQGQDNSNTSNVNKIDMSGFITREEFESRLSELTTKKKTTARKEDVENG